LSHSEKNPPPLIEFKTGTIEHMTLFKMLGLTVANNFNWDKHVNAIYVKASKRLRFLKLFKRSSVAYFDDLLQYYKSIIRPVLDYACPE
jgi:hypothetical protein